MISEVSLVLILLVSTGLITKSLWRLLSVDPGFRREKLLARQPLLACGAVLRG